MHLEPFGLSVHAFGWTGQGNIIPTCRSAGNYYLTWAIDNNNVSCKVSLTPCTEGILIENGTRFRFDYYYRNDKYDQLCPHLHTDHVQSLNHAMITETDSGQCGTSSKYFSKINSCLYLAYNNNLFELLTATYYVCLYMSNIRCLIKLKGISISYC